MEDSSVQVDTHPVAAVATARKTITLKDGTPLHLLKRELSDPSVAVLYLHLHESFLQNHTLQQIDEAFQDANLPNLVGIKVDRPEKLPDQSRNFPVTAINSLLQSGTKLEYLIVDLNLIGSSTDYAELGRIAGKLGKLQCVGLTLGVLREDGLGDNNSQQQRRQQQRYPNQNKNVMDPLIQSLSTLPNLTDIIIKGVNWSHTQTLLGPLKSASLDKLCRLPKLTSLYLFLFVLSDENVSAMARAISSNPLLKELCLQCTLGSEGASMISHMLKQNSSLKDFILIALRYELQSTAPTLIEKLEDEIAHGLSQSTSLEEFLFQGGPDLMSTHSVRRFRRAMDTNFILQKLILRCDSSDPDLSHHYNGIQFLLRLNQHGRGKLLTDKSVFQDQRWVHMLANSSDKVEDLYYYLSKHPSLCQVPSQQSTTTSGSSITANVKSKKRKRLYRAVKYTAKSYKC